MKNSNKRNQNKQGEKDKRSQEEYLVGSEGARKSERKAPNLEEQRKATQLEIEKIACHNF